MRLELAAFPEYPGVCWSVSQGLDPRSTEQTRVRQNRPLLIFLGAMLVLGLAMWLPDYIACHPMHASKSADEARIEASEVRDVSKPLPVTALASGYLALRITSIQVDYHTLTVVGTEQSLSPATTDEDDKAWSARLALIDAWTRSYSQHHGNVGARDECLWVIWKSRDGTVVDSCQTRDSVARLITNTELC